MRDVFVAREEPQEGPPLLRCVVADRPTEHWEAHFERIENGALRRHAIDGEFNVAVDSGQYSQMQWQDDANHDDQVDEQSPPLR